MWLFIFILSINTMGVLLIVAIISRKNKNGTVKKTLMWSIPFFIFSAISLSQFNFENDVKVKETSVEANKDEEINNKTKKADSNNADEEEVTDSVVRLDSNDIKINAATGEETNKEQSENIFDMNETLTPKYTVFEEIDISIPGATRYRIKISVPLGLSKEELEFNLSHALKTGYEKYRPDAITVFAYREDDDLKQSFSAGMIEFAPYGDWSRADEDVELEKYDTVIEIAETYLNPKVTLEVGSMIQFSGDVSAKSKSWQSEDIIVSLPELTTAKILDINKYPMGKVEFIRYQIEFTYEDINYTGWVHGYDIKQ